MLQILKSMYQLAPTKDNTGLTTTTTLSDKKVDITVYNNTMRMLIQGTGCRDWIDTVLEHITCDLKKSKYDNDLETPSSILIRTQLPTESTPKEKSSEHHSMSLTPSPINSLTQTAQKKITKSKSTGILSTVSKAIFGPSINSGVLKLGKELKKAEKK